VAQADREAVMSTFAERLRTARKARGVPLKQAAGDAGILTNTWTQYENGYCEPALPKLRAICKALDASADYLLGITDTDER
jgi:transcriptional regulator with XRE-family HTH domain